MKSENMFSENLAEALSSEPDRPADGFEGRIDVFLSYSSKNKNIADAVVAEFEQHGIRCWYAPRDIVPGQEWVSAIHDAITACSLFVLIYTDSSNESRQVANEVALAFNSGKTLIPFRLTEAEMNSELEYYLTRVHWLDAVNPPLRKSIQNLREYSERILKGEVPKESKEKNANTAGGGRKTAFRWLSPALAVLAVAVVAGVIVLAMSSNRNKPSGGSGDSVTPTGTEATVTEPAGSTHFPNDAKELYEKARGLVSGGDKAAYDEAYKCFLKTDAALTDDEETIAAMVTLAEYYYENDELANAPRWLLLYKKAAACGSIKANNFLGNYYLEADRDRKSEGSSRADMNLDGTAVSSELFEAVSYYSASAERGDAIALYSLGFIYENENDAFTITPNLAKALAYYMEADQAGHPNAAKALERVQGKLQES